MDDQLEIRHEGEYSRGPGVTPGKLFSWENLLLLGVIVCLLLSLLVYQYVRASRTLISYVGFPVSIVLFCILAKRHRLWKRRDIHLLLIGLAWILIAFVLNLGRINTRDLLPHVATVFSITLLCYPLGLVTAKERRVKTLRALAWLWVIPIVCTAVIAIILSLSRTVLYRADGAMIGLVKGRLHFLCDPNMYGMLCCMALSLVFYLLLGKRRLVMRVLLVLMALCLFVAMTLTGSRSVRVALLIAGFFFAALVIWRLLRKRKNVLRLLAGCLAGAAFSAALLFGYRGVTTGANSLIAALARATVNTPIATSTPSATDTPVATSTPSAANTVGDAAEASAADSSETPASAATTKKKKKKTNKPAPVATRELDDTTSVLQRFGIVVYALERLPEEPDVLLRGATPALSLELFIDPAAPYNHLHNAYLSVLLSYGIPGFLILAVLLIGLFVCLCRLLFSPRSDLPLELRLLPGIVLTILAINFVESMLFTRDFVSEFDVWLAIISGFAVAFSHDCRKGAKNAPAIDA